MVRRELWEIRGEVVRTDGEVVRTGDKRSDSPLPHENPDLYRRPADEGPTRWIPPVAPEPVVPAMEIPYVVDRARTGTIKAVQFDLDEAEARAEHRPQIPAGLKSCMKTLVLLGERLPGAHGPVVSYARGFDTTSTGEAKCKPVWDMRDDEESGKTHRVKVGELDPEPVDSFVVRVQYVRDDGTPAMIAGSWIEGKPWTFGIADGRKHAYMEFRPWKTEIDQKTEDCR